jgi:ribosomal protein S9
MYQAEGLQARPAPAGMELPGCFLPMNETNTASLKANGFLTKIPEWLKERNMEEVGARRRFQFSKR